ncbi:metal-binding protein [Romboutsia weinsteinii]|uniref:Metal-binding protein n=1 Tax=Romboutsia weinsteinii TaxID=2020949 RepID=A0A371J905_9FIRM|nr:cysteine-rich small domain-containing protein [Romboutsia weinsteinii]RDY29193.1 metal-binding protein [Romboutsia weinsteinii]
MSDNYKFFNHKNCEYFPCHKTSKPEEFNCLFCYCPLYALGKNCGGNFKYSESGIKDCSSCMLPHNKKNYEYIMSKFQDIVKVASKED